MKLIKSSVSIMLTLLLIVSLFTIVPFEAGAAGAITIINHHWDSSNQKVVEDSESVTDYSQLNSNDDDLESGIYAVKSNTTASNRLHVAEGETVGIYLGDGATLTCNNGIQVDKGGTLNIYGATSSSGTLSINMNNGSRGRFDAAIGSNDGDDSGDIIFHGGNVNVIPKHGNRAAGIGGGYKGAPKCVTVWDGVVKSKCDDGYYSYGSAIGGGKNAGVSWQGSGKTGVAIYGGKVEAKARYGAGIGNGDTRHSGDNLVSGNISTPKCDIAIYGGEITATTLAGAGIGGGYGNRNGPINIRGGKITAASKGETDWNDSGAGIGGGGYASQSGKISISGGIVIAAGVQGAGIGGGSNNGSGIINITGGTVIATSTRGGAGIGGGYKANADSPITIENANVAATSKNYELGDYWENAVNDQIGRTNWYSSGEMYYATGLKLISWFLNWFSCEESGAAIGGGEKGGFSTITIKNSEVTANSGGYSAAIGSGDEGGNGGTINIENSNVTAKAGTDAAGIGGGNECKVDTINITRNSNVTAKNQGYGAAIGGGDDAGFGTININNSDVTADGREGKYGAGIGSGEKGEDSGTINITNNSTVHAYGGKEGAGVGSGNEAKGHVKINISDSYVRADGGKLAAGIGGGDLHNPEYIKISSSKIEANGGSDGAGIGSGDETDCSYIEITSSSDVLARGGNYGAGIGGGDDGDSGTIEISGSIVKAYGGTDAAGIGGGEGGDGGNIKIYNSDVYAEGNDNGSGIGNGEDGDESDIEISGGSCIVEALGGNGGGHAFGHADNGIGYSSHISISITDDANVKAGDSSDKAKSYSGKNRFSAMWDNRYAKVFNSTCIHMHKGWRYYDAISHREYCLDCGRDFNTFRSHTFNDNDECTVCHAKADIVNIVFKEKDKNNNDITHTLNARVKGKITAPECENAPEGYEFVGWHESNSPYQYNFTLPGEETSVDTGRTFEALYLPVVDAEYIDENGNLQTVKARRITEQSNTNNAMLLTEGWYIVDSNVVIPRQIFHTGNVKMIIADGKTLSFSAFNPYFSDEGDRPAFYPLYIERFGEKFTLYGQREQTGVLDVADRTPYFDFLTINGGVFNMNLNRKSVGCVVNSLFTMNAGKLQGGDVNGFYCGSGFVFNGGDVELNYASMYEKAKLKWTRRTDKIKLNNFITSGCSVVIEDSQMFKDDDGNIYEGTLTSEQMNAIKGKTLVPYIGHSYGEPVWEWSDNYEKAEAVFTCTDDDCDKQVRVEADIKNVDENNIRTATATCKFLGDTYSDTKTFKLLYDINTIINDSSMGSVAVSKDKAKPHEKIKVELTPEDGYAIRSLTVTTADGNESIEVNDNTFYMPESDVNVNVSFSPTMPENEPYIDSSGEYHLGNIEWTWINGEKHKINEDRTVGEKVDSIDLSYFDFNLLDNNTYQINYYTGPLNITELVIPKTFNGKPITVLGNNMEKNFMDDVEENSEFVLTLNENITEIKPYLFYFSKCITKVQGDTSNLKTIGKYAFSFVNSSNDYNFEINLFYSGEMNNGSGCFNHLNSTIHLKHTTEFSYSSAWGRTVNYDFIDAHPYDEPVWEWNGTQSAKATFTCPVERCKHTETANAAITKSEEIDKTVYTATVDINGQLYTDTKNVEKACSAITVETDGNGTVTPNKNSAYTGEEITLDINPETGYKLKTLSVKDESDKDIELKDCAFIMPASAVKISAVFEEKNYDIIYSDTDDGNITGDYSANYGDEVELGVYPYGGYELDTLTVKDTNDNIIPVENNKFTMPASDVNVTATFNKIDLKITYGPYAHGSITGADTARVGDEVPITITPDEGYAYTNLYAEDDEWRDPANIFDNVLYMIGGDVTVYADFVPIIPKTEPYIDENGEYHTGNVAYVDLDGYCFAVNDDGSVGEELDSVELSYFEFEQLSDSTYQINKYTGPTDINELIIPKTYKGKPVTVVGKDDRSKFIKYKDGDTVTQFSLVLNENITQVSQYTFYTLMVKDVKGDTSNLNTLGRYAFSWANGMGDFCIDVKLDYPGRITLYAGTFNNMNVIIHMKHSANFSNNPSWAKSVTYDFTDAHTYAEPEWSWNADYSSASAKFACTNSKCYHEESVGAQVTREYNNGNFIYTATAEFEGETYTDTKTVKADNPLEKGYHPSITASEAALKDGNLFNLPSDLEYKKASLLGVQKKEALQTASGGTGLRFIAEMSSGYLESADDYGFEIVKTKKQNTKDFNDSDGFTKMQTLLDSGSKNIKTVSCKGTTNTVANPEYGDKNAESTTYKYVTMAVKNIPDEQGIAVRFYVELDGIRYYSRYTNADGTFIGCCSSYNTLLSLDVATKDEV